MGEITQEWMKEAPKMRHLRSQFKKMNAEPTKKPQLKVSDIKEAYTNVWDNITGQIDSEMHYRKLRGSS